MFIFQTPGGWVVGCVCINSMLGHACVPFSRVPREQVYSCSNNHMHVRLHVIGPACLGRVCMSMRVIQAADWYWPERTKVRIKVSSMTPITANEQAGLNDSNHGQWTSRAQWLQSRPMNKQGSMTPITANEQAGLNDSNHGQWTSRAQWLQSRPMNKQGSMTPCSRPPASLTHWLTGQSLAMEVSWPWRQWACGLCYWPERTKVRIKVRSMTPQPAVQLAMKAVSLWTLLLARNDSSWG
jgi:hypothetical protein